MRYSLIKLKLARNIYAKILKYKYYKKPIPLLVTFGITNRCNLKCNYCFVNPESRNKDDMPTERLLDYIDQFIDLGTEQIDLQGGEPTLHPELGILISRIVERGVECTIATNGFRVDKYLADLKKCFVVCVSIDGLPETTDINRGKGAYEIAVLALDTMANHNINIRIHGVLTHKTNFADIDHLVALSKKYNTNVNFVYALDTGIKKTDCNGVGFSWQIKEIAKYLSELKSKGAPIVSKEGAIQQVLRWPFGSQEILTKNEMTTGQMEEMKILKIPKCLWGHLACFFNTDGSLYLCPRAFDRDGYFVKIDKKSIREAFNELANAKKCYMCGQMGDLSYSFNFNLDNFKTWLKF